jgi:aspartate aminotransferase
MTAEQFRNAITPKTKCLILNSPNNPTGAVYSENEIREIASICEEKGLFVISDEIYEKLVYANEKHFSIAQVSDYMKEHTVIINGMSKTYAMTGWRIGYLAAPTAIAKAISSMQSHTTSNPCSISQYASTEALVSPEGDKFIEKMQKIFDERRRFMVEYLKDVKDIVCIEPKGAFYVFVDVSKYYGKTYNGKKVEGSLSFADLALGMGVALIPGVAFGDDNCIRLSYAISDADIVKGVTRIGKFVSLLK